MQENFVRRAAPALLIDQIEIPAYTENHYGNRHPEVWVLAGGLRFDAVDRVADDSDARDKIDHLVEKGQAVLLQDRPMAARAAPQQRQFLPSLAEAQKQQSRYIAGRSFFQNGNQWIDSGVQALKDQQAKRIAFASEEYFDLLRKHPEAKEWLALGRNIQLTIDGQFYDVYESEGGKL